MTPGSDSYLPLLAYQNNSVQDCRTKATEGLTGIGPKLLPVDNLDLLMNLYAIRQPYLYWVYNFLKLPQSQLILCQPAPLDRPDQKIRPEIKPLILKLIKITECYESNCAPLSSYDTVN